MSTTKDAFSSPDCPAAGRHAMLDELLTKGVPPQVKR
jgi:hypothetical protein